MVTKIPKKYHNATDVVQDKKAELRLFKKFYAYKEVKDVGQDGL